MNPDRISQCYILRHREESIYKIGVSWEPKRRAWATHSTLLWAMPGGVEEERALHENFAHLNIYRGDLSGKTEWYVDADGSIAEFLARYGVQA